ncbi:MAG: hypothetical protein IKJ46_03390, partial [Tidjanibacter sp.]|nr:hypothetical protein [Tidjanibacter sp.]
MKHLTSTLLFALIATLCIHSCAPAEGWTSEERTLINSAAYSRMRVTQTDNTADSLLLRTKSKPLSHGQLQSAEFGRLVA